MRMLYCPARSPLKASRRLLGRARKSSRRVAAERRSNPEKAGTLSPVANCAVRLSRYPKIMPPTWQGFTLNVKRKSPPDAFLLRPASDHSEGARAELDRLRADNLNR